MLFVCDKHILDGLKQETAPHIKRLPDSYMKKCRFCRQNSVYKLYTHHIFGVIVK